MNSLVCETCGNAIAANAPSGLCPTCLLRTAIEHGSSRALAPFLPRLRYFGDYELLEEIARGGMGVVYRARQVSLDRVVALKMMRPGLLSTEQEIQRFLTEARTAASLKHPNIVAIHEAGELDGLHYFSMDFVEGPNLAEIVREGPLSPVEAARYVKTLAETVQYAHTKGVLHRDLKPSNVVMDASGRPCITDFGVARRLDGDATLSGTGAVIGTPAYMPPEQASGQMDRISAASDVYSLGAILYELLTGHPPFRAGNQLEIVRLVLETEAPRPSLVNPAVDPAIEAICLRCLAKEPSDRFASAAELAGDLGRYLGGEPVHAPAIGKAPVFSTARWLYAAGALIALAIAWSVLRTPDRKPAAPPHPVVSTSVPAAPTAAAAPGQPTAEKPVAKAAPSPRPTPSTAIASLSLPHLQTPLVASVAPASGTGYQQTFTFRYAPFEDSDRSDVEVDFSDADSTTPRHCNIRYERSTGRLQLQADAMLGPGLRVSGDPGTLNRLENSICAIDLADVTVAWSPDGTELKLPITFKPAFDGVKKIESWIWKKQGAPRSETSMTGQWTIGPRS